MGTFRLAAAASMALPLVFGLSSAALGQTATPATAAATKPDADAIAALTKMGEALRAMNAFTVKADVTTEQVLGSGQKLQYHGDLQIEARRPNGFKIAMKTDLQNREIYYDGKSVTLFAPNIGYYASAPAPGTIIATLDAAKSKYGLEIPLADLFSLGADPALITRIKSGFDVGPETVNGQTCEHYAFRQESVDWQVWIRKEGPALPCKMVITNTEDPSMPQYVAVLTWDANQTFAQDAFTFKAPADAHKINLADASAVAK